MEVYEEAEDLTADNTDDADSSGSDKISND